MNRIAASIVAAAAGLAGPAFGQDAPAAPAERAPAPAALNEELGARRAEFEAKAPPEVVEDYNRGVEDVRGLGLLRTAKQVGDRAPDFVLKDHEGRNVRLRELLERGPVVLTWYRGGWCPYCNIQLKAYQDVLPDIHARGAQLVALSPETPDNSLSTKEKNELEFVALSDPANAVARKYGVAYRLPERVKRRFEGRLDLPEFNGDDSWELPLGATYVIGRDGTIVYAFLSADYRERAEPAAILGALDAIGGSAPPDGREEGTEEPPSR